jgi:protein ImuB
MKRIACIHLSDADGDSPIDGKGDRHLLPERPFGCFAQKVPVTFSPSPIEFHRLQIVECCGRFSPIVAFEPTDGSVLLDLTGLAHLFGGEAAMLEAVVRDLAALGLTGRAAVADTIGAAWAASHYCERGIANCKLQIANLQFPILNFQSFAFLHALPIESLRLPSATLRLLHDLGLTSVGQLEAIPRDEFLSRFGPELLRRIDQAFGRWDEPLPACPLPPTFEAHWSAEHPTARRETIAAAIEHLIARVAALLARRGRGALRLDCRLDMESHQPAAEALSIGLFQPTADAKRLFELVELRLERLRITSPVGAVHVAASLHAPLEPRKQATLFDLDGDGRQPLQLAALVERLASRLGSEAVGGVRLRPEAQPELSWHDDPLVGVRRRKLAGMVRRNDRATEIAGTNHPTLPPRPLRLLPRPALLAVTSIAPDGPPLRFQFDGQEHTVARSWGPERIETGWWRSRSIGRDYFRVETTVGCRYWLFRRLCDGRWFLHGLFE